MSTTSSSAPPRRRVAWRDAEPPGDDRLLVISLHDVHTGSWRRYRSFVDELAAAGIGRTSLLVVPHWKGAERIDASPELAEWLRATAARGHDVCLHGLVHGVERVRGGALAQLIGRFYTAREGEFHRLGYEAAARRLRDGRALLARAGLDTAGFTPPAWLAGREVLYALADLGFLYSTTLGSLILPGAGLRLRAPTLVFSSRSRWRQAGSLAWVPLWARLTVRARVLRLAVHPGDLVVPAIRRSLGRLIRAVAAGRRSTTYRDLAAAIVAGAATPGERASTRVWRVFGAHQTNPRRDAHRLSIERAA